MNLSKYKFDANLSQLPQPYYNCFGIYRCDYKRIILNTNLTFEVEHYYDFGGRRWSNLLKGDFIYFENKIYFFQESLKPKLKLGPMHIFEKEGKLFLKPILEDKENLLYYDLHWKWDYPNALVCINNEEFPDALTVNKWYYAIKKHDYKNLIWIVGDNNRVRWFPIKFFSEKILL